MHQLNREISNIQRELIKEKHILDNTLDKLNIAYKELEQLNATKDKFFSIIAHDLKNPFNALIGFSHILMHNTKDYSSGEIENFATHMNTVSKEAYTLLENLLEWSRLQTGKLIPNIIETVPSDLIFEVKLLCQPMAISKEINLETDISVNNCILADKEMLKTVLRNLVTNALKFTHPKGTITISTKAIEDYIQFTVSDTGIGIEQEYLDRLFLVDCKLSKPGTSNEKGTGLGLILCREFVEKNKGKIWVESKVGIGSSFIFTIPLCQL